MASSLKTPAAMAWLALVAATSASAWLGDGHGPPEVAAVAVIAVAFFKVRLVGRYFMELRGAPLALRLVFDGWVVVACVALTGIYLIAG
jgi:hypothetical protein